MIAPFTLMMPPSIHFGTGSVRKIGALAARFGNSSLLITGGASLSRSGKLDEIEKCLSERSVLAARLSVSGEPSPESVDEAVWRFGKERIDVVIAVGGGSVMDFGKAVSAMLIFGREPGVSVVEYLEGVGTRTHDGRKVPLIAVPTTAGTGSEATKNAVLSRVGKDGFKKSLRHDNFVPNVALIDPDLSLTCPAPVTAACGMDALSQLLESYFSTAAHPMTDALALSGIAAVGRSLIRASLDGPDDLDARTQMAYGALVSGITLANAGLGLVHGMASVLGGAYNISHGIVCANLVGPAMKRTHDALERAAEGGEAGALDALRKFARAGVILDGREETGELDAGRSSGLLIEKLSAWTERLNIPRLGAFGVQPGDIGRLASESDNKNNPARLSAADIGEVLKERL